MDASSMPNYRNPHTQRELRQMIDRAWMPHLAPFEFVLVVFIFDRTISWGKTHEIIKLQHFTEGVVTREGRKVSGHVNSTCQTWVSESLAELVLVGALHRRRVQAGYEYALNLEWEPVDTKKVKRRINRSNKMRDVERVGRGEPPTGLRLQPKSDFGSTLSQTSAPTLLPKRKENTNDSVEYRKGPADAGNASVGELLNAAKDKSREKREKRIKAKGLRAKDILYLWREAVGKAPWRGSVECALEITGRDALALASYSKRFGGAYPQHAFSEYFIWCIRNWMTIIGDVFHWMSDPPAAPIPLFMVKHAHKFEQAWLQRVSIQASTKLTPEERQIKRLIAKGMAPEAAREKVFGKPTGGKVSTARVIKRRRMKTLPKEQDTPMKLPTLDELMRESEGSEFGPYKEPDEK